MIHHPRIAVSSWSLHNTLGYSHANGPGGHDDAEAKPTWGKGSLTLMDLPPALAAHGYGRVELCHFHIASLDLVYLEELLDAFRSAGVVIQTVLIDDGDITNPQTRTRDMAWIHRWIDGAARLGALHARVIAGKQKPTPENIALGISGLKALAHSAATRGIKLVTENWFDLTSTPEAVHQILDGVGSDLGLMADTGNWSWPTKYADLQSIFARAQLCHAKVSFGSGLKMDEADYRLCLEASRRAEYEGPYTLIFDSEGDEWAGLDAERKFIVEFLADPHV